MTFYEEISKLKTIAREGWERRNVPTLKRKAESDAEHVYSAILLALDVMAKNDLKLDELKVVKMLAYHELGEIEVGDITPFDGVPLETKFKGEYACIKRLAKKYKISEIETLWLEFSAQKTKEAIFVKMIDKFDAVLQAKIFDKNYSINGLYQDFVTNNQKVCEYFKNLKF